MIVTAASARLDPPLRSLLDPDALLDPHDRYRSWRASAPVAWDEGTSSWVVTSYAVCRDVLQDVTTFGSDRRRAGLPLPPSMLSIQTLDPPEHTEIRHQVLAALRRYDLRTADTAIAAAVDDVLDRAVAGTTVDFVRDVAQPLALQVIADVLGVTPPDAAWFVPVSTAIVDSMDAGLAPERLAAGVAAREELAALATTWLDHPDRPGLVAAFAAGLDEWDTDPVVVANTVRAFAHAGFESVGRLLAGAATVLLAEHRLPSAVPLSERAAAELVRYVSPVQGDARVCVRDTELAGVPIRTGEVVTLLLAAANHDPAAFPEPDRLVLDREPNHHLGFGRGAHACVGAALGLRVLRAALDGFGRRFPAATLVESPAWAANATLRGPAAVLVSPTGRERR
ncbi:Cytochrome P450 [Jatrophihabitans endophyticus]|uniref:Cytochrome P450 n=1 Tax=Jatrophihabitans endophyticus TaxID=1206085 RepID=A0A1M5HKV7_9ACTN|nr:cytochrome P450 [Jatrophihabitans endophyticus]SHG16593.1 Cytochrome P450 [Jatrophihabitans endophyticus]